MKTAIMGCPTEMRYRRDLWKLIAHFAPLGGAAEVGVAEGLFAEDILNWPIDLPFVFLVDRWRSMPSMKGDSAKPQSWHDANRIKATTRVEKFGTRARILQMESSNAAVRVGDGTLSFINIDADHSYQGVTVDLLSWWPKLKPGGVIAFHDHEQPAYGVKRAVAEFAREHNLTVYLLPEDKAEDAGAFLIKPC